MLHWFAIHVGFVSCDDSSDLYVPVTVSSLFARQINGQIVLIYSLLASIIIKYALKQLDDFSLEIGVFT